MSEPAGSPDLRKRSSQRSPLRGLQVFSAVSVLAAAVLAVNSNVLVARFYRRWDVTSERLYTLSQATRHTLSSLKQPVEVLVLLSRGDPLRASVRQMLTAYAGESEKVRVDFLDPEQNPAQFLAIQHKYQILAGKTEEGRVVTDASVIIAQGDRHWFIRPDDMMAYDSESGNVRPRLEQALTEGIVNVLGHEKATICFSRGHRELSLNDSGPEGLVELRDRIEKSNYLSEERDLPSTSKGGAFDGCRVLVIAGPRLSFDAKDAEVIRRSVEAGTSALLLLPPIVDQNGTIRSVGLDSVVSLAGAELGQNLLIETDPSLRLPRGLGEVFFAAPQNHQVTAGLLKGGAKIEFRVLVSEAQGLTVSAADSKPLLRSSEQALAVSDVHSLSDGTLDDARPARTSGGVVLGVARQLEKPKDGARAPRLVLFGADNLVQNRSFRDSGLYGDRILIENSVAWLADRPELVSVPEKPLHEIGLALSEEALGEVLRYVLIYMPGSAALLGLTVIVRRRVQEKRSRKSGDSRAEQDEART